MMTSKGILAVNKPMNWTSFDVCNKIKHMVKPLKVGHLGTLDPMATGVLLVTIGKATKLFDLMQEKIKTYIAEFEFGKLTDTLDATGEVVNTSTNVPTIEDIQSVIPKFLGKISQIPPKYSAKNINGKRAYELAREHQEFELSAKEVCIYDIKIISYTENILKVQISCGSGTYIRAIGRDIAESLNTYATMTSLVRTAIGKFSIEKCINIENLSVDDIWSNLSSIDDVLGYKTIALSDNERFKILNGQTLNIVLTDGKYCLKTNENIDAILDVKNNVVKMSIFLA